MHVFGPGGLSARLIGVPWLPMGTGAMTFGSWILIVKSQIGNRLLIAHEMVHVRQWKEIGRLRFLAGYLKAYFSGRIRGMGHWAAYAAIPHEVQAHTQAPTLEPRLTFISRKERKLAD